MGGTNDTKFGIYIDAMEKKAVSKWKSEYENLSYKNKEKLKKNVMKSNKDIANGINKGTNNLIKEYGFEDKVDNKSFQGFRNNKNNGKIEIVSPKNLADVNYSKLDNVSMPEKVALKVFDKFTGVKKLSKEDKELYNAIGKRNVVNKLTKGFDAQIAQEGAFGNYYNDKNINKRMKLVRRLSHPNNNKQTKEIFRNYGKNIDVNDVMKNIKNKNIENGAISIAQNKPYSPIYGNHGKELAMEAFNKNSKKYKSLATKLNSYTSNKKKRAKLIPYLGASIGGVLYMKNKIDNKQKQKDKIYADAMEKKAKSNEGNDDNKLNSAITGTAGLGLMAKSKDKIIGQKTLYHGTSKSAWKDIKEKGMQANKGGTGGASAVAGSSGAGNIADASKGKVYLTGKKGKAFAYSRRSATSDAIKEKLNSDAKVQKLNEIRKNHRIGKGKYDFDVSTPEGKKALKETYKLAGHEKNVIRKEMANPKNRDGKVIKVKMDYNKWKNDFELDPDETSAKVHKMLGGGKIGEAVGKDFAARTSKDVTKDEIVGLHNAGSRVMKRMKNLPNYIKTNPKRFGAGVAMAGAGGALLNKSIKDMSKEISKNEKKAEIIDYAIEKVAAKVLTSDNLNIGNPDLAKKVNAQNFGTGFVGAPSLRAQAGANDTSGSTNQVAPPVSGPGVSVSPAGLSTPSVSTGPSNILTKARDLFTKIPK